MLFRSVYAVGALLFALVAGRPPYEGTSSFAVLQRHLKDPVPDLCAAASDAPRALGAAVQAMMAKEASERPTAAGALELLATLPAETLALEDAGQAPRRGAREPESREAGLGDGSSFNLEQTKGLTSSARWRAPGASSGSGSGRAPPRARRGWARARASRRLSSSNRHRVSPSPERSPVPAVPVTSMCTRQLR